MSSDNKTEAEAADIKCCASCGTKETNTNEVKLKDCSACHLVKYCGVKCQKQHRKKHKRACKQREAELRDEILFRQPERSYLGDCPICFLPLSLDRDRSTLYHCCSKYVCNGCGYANQLHEFKDRVTQRCPFCRTPLTGSYEEDMTKSMERVALTDDPVALRQIGWKHYNKGEFEEAFDYYTRAAKLGDAEAHLNLSQMYQQEGHGVEKNNEKAVYHWEEAAIAGVPEARHNLALYEVENERNDRAVKHWIIAANLGHTHSLTALKALYTTKLGYVTKDDFAAALRAHQAAVDATKSPQREEAAKSTSLL